MEPVVLNNQTWRVVRVSPGDPRLIDRTGVIRVATTDPDTRTISILETLTPPLLDQVLLHEMAHAITISHELLEPMHEFLPRHLWLPMEEWSAQLVEQYSIEAVVAASESLGRPVCVKGVCIG